MLVSARAFLSLRGLLRKLRIHHRRILATVVILLALDTLITVLARPVTRRYANQVEEYELGNTTVYIASIHRNTEAMLRGRWNDAIVDLATTLGPANLHLVAVESGSQDGTKKALADLGDRLNALGVSNTIDLGMTVSEQANEIESRPPPEGDRRKDWIWNAADARYELRRIPYLAKLRNQAMSPLTSLAAQGRRFDKVLWVNDVVFDTEDVLNLLATKSGQYAAACSMDFKLFPRYYDTFALRDDQGQKTSSYYFPWFVSSAARASLWRGEPVKVYSCWNGMVSFNSAPFYADAPLQFRGIPDSLADHHLEASECCLIHADNPLSTEPDRGVWLNPNVRVGYNEPTYRQVKGERFPGTMDAITGTWSNRFWRIRMRIQLLLEGWTVHSRLRKWRMQTPGPSSEVGQPCLINEMQVMWQNGWKHL